MLKVLYFEPVIISVLLDGTININIYNISGIQTVNQVEFSRVSLLY
jgi:hypothetical protein